MEMQASNLQMELQQNEAVLGELKKLTEAREAAPNGAWDAAVCWSRAEAVCCEAVLLCMQSSAPRRCSVILTHSCCLCVLPPRNSACHRRGACGCREGAAAPAGAGWDTARGRVGSHTWRWCENGTTFVHLAALIAGMNSLPLNSPGLGLSSRLQRSRRHRRRTAAARRERG